MLKELRTTALCFLTAVLLTGNIFPQAIRDGGLGNGEWVLNPQSLIPTKTLPLKRLALFSSGVGYFEHSGQVSGSVIFNLGFNRNAVNDALKSLVVNDPRTTAPMVRYPSEDTLYRTLRSLSVDLSGDPGIGEILNNLKGAELDLIAPNPLSGRIIGVEERSLANGAGTEACLSLFTAGGIRVIALREVSVFSFKDPVINADFNRALDLLMVSRTSERRDLRVELNGEGSRDVSLSYVIPVPVWKVSYRLDLSGPEALLQGWAIVDNDGDTDWENVELSLVTGRPVSFIQNLYPPLRLSRPVLPLSIAGIAQAETHDSSWGNLFYETADEMAEAASSASKAAVAERAYAPVSPAPAVAGGRVETAGGAALGDQFEFTLKRPVTLARQQSAMLPLVEGTVKAEKALIFSGQRMIGADIHPASGAELVNTTGMKLPAGPLTVYDGGSYAGDALIEFFPTDDKRLVSWGEDLSVSGSAQIASSRVLTTVTVSSGLMTINRKQNYERTYTLRNASGEAKRIILEHPVTGGAALAEPPSFDERSTGLYRFIRSLPPRGELSFTVREESPIAERITLSQLRPDALVSYSSNQEIPQAVRDALRRALELRQGVDKAQGDLRDLETRRDRLISEQDRIRRNLEAAGSQTQQGRDYLTRMTAIDTEIDEMGTAIDQASAAVKTAQAAYDNYLGSLNL